MIEELVAELRKHDRVEICYKTGVSPSTLNTLISGANKNPTIKTLNALRKFLDEKEAQK